MNKYNIGDVVWYANRESKEKQIICPDCFGKKYLTVIKGDGSTVTIECAGCQLGYDPPRGYQTFWEQTVSVAQRTIEKVMIERDYTEYVIYQHYGVKECDLFDNEEDAKKRAIILAEEHNREELAKINMKEKHNRTWSWHACYHRRGIKEAERQLAYHTSKLNIAKIKSKEDKLV